MKILVAGDFCQKNRVDSFIRSKSFDLLFDDVKKIVKSQDYSIVNLECPIVIDDKHRRKIHKFGPVLFSTKEIIDAVNYLGFKCCTLANNHILDQGGVCCVDTIKELKENGIDSVGAGSNLDEASSILYKSINGETLAIINCTENEFSIATDKGAGANPLNSIKLYYSIKEARKFSSYVLVIIHGGHENYQYPSLRMVELYRYLIDVGADAVINGHQHCFSGYEVYNNKPIIYGLGNFCFDYPNKVNSPWNKGYMVSLELTNGQTKLHTLYPYEQCNGTPGITLLKDRTNFDVEIAEINNVIADEKRLKEQINTYYQESSFDIINMFLSPSNRYLNKLFRMGIIPSFMSSQRLSMIHNYINCEAHRDKVLYAFDTFFKNKKKYDF